MRDTLGWIILFCCFCVISASAQTRKPGLWELTTNTTWQTSPFPGGMPNVPAAGPNSPFGGGTHTMMVCLTQEQIDRYGAITPSTRNCQISNVVKSSSHMSADWVCSGKMSGKGTLESSFEGNRAKGKVHFVGSLQAGPNPRPIEWTAESTSVFKGPDCGSVKPLPMPNK
jgi:hypothetical protein